MGGCTHTELLNKVESNAFSLIDSPSLTDCLQPLTLRYNVASLAIFYRNFYVNRSSELANCMPSPPHNGFAAHIFLLTLISILSTRLMQELTSIFTLFSLLLVNSRTLYLNLYFHLTTTWTHLRDLSRKCSCTHVRVSNVLTFNGVQWDFSHDTMHTRTTWRKRPSQQGCTRSSWHAPNCWLLVAMAACTQVSRYADDWKEGSDGNTGQWHGSAGLSVKCKRMPNSCTNMTCFCVCVRHTNRNTHVKET